MRIETELRPKDIPPAMEWLTSQFGATLKKRVANLEAGAGRNPLLNFTKRYFSLEFALDEALKRHRTTSRYPRGNTYDLGYAFAVTAKRLWENLDQNARKQFSGKMRDGLKGPYGLRPLTYEVQILTHLCRRGFDVICADLDGKGNFDFLATRSGVELEVECKTTAPDAGQKIHFDHLISLGGKLYPILQSLVDAGGHHLIRIQVPNRLLADETTTIRIASLVNEAILAGSAAVDDVATVHYRCPVNKIFQAASDIEGQARAMFRMEFEWDAGSILIYSGMTGWSFAGVAVQSLKQDNVIDALSNRAKEAAKQFSGTRPALIAMQLLEMSPETLKEAIERPSRLYDITKSVFENPYRRHVNSIVFTLPPHIRQTALSGVSETTGIVGMIQNPSPTFPSALACDLFSPGTMI